MLRERVASVASLAGGLVVGLLLVLSVSSGPRPAVVDVPPVTTMGSGQPAAAVPTAPHVSPFVEMGDDR